MIYDLNEKKIDDEKLLKESSFDVLKSFIKELLKLINDFIIESNIIMQIRDLYKNDEIFQ